MLVSVGRYDTVMRKTSYWKYFFPTVFDVFLYSEAAILLFVRDHRSTLVGGAGGDEVRGVFGMLCFSSQSVL